MSFTKHSIVIFLGNAEAPIFEEALKSFPLQYCLSICKRKEFMPKLAFTGDLRGTCHEWHHPDEFDENMNDFLPLDEELIERMRSCEVRALAMYERLEGRGNLLSYPERKRLYLRQLRFCNHILATRAIDLLLLTAIPHHGIAYILYALCKEKNIPVLCMNQWDPFPDLFSIDESWEDPVPALRERYKNIKNNARDPQSIDLMPAFEEYFIAHAKTVEKAQKKIDPHPWYMALRNEGEFRQWLRLVQQMFRKDLWRFLYHAITFLPRRLRPSFLRERFRRVFSNRRARKMYRFYDAHAKSQDLSRRYVYVPLHIQPEVTTLPMGGAYADQILMVQMLNALLPEDVLIYVKEHPIQEEIYPDGKGRSIMFYEDFLQCARVRFVPTTENTYHLTENAVAVATVTGTAGLEALFRGKPALLFGHRYFQYAPGVFAVRTVEDCKKALHVILEERVSIPPLAMRCFLKACEGIVREGSIDVAHQRISRFLPAENAERVGKVIAEELVRRGWKKMRIVAIIQARMGSARLPGKVLMPIEGRPLLSYVVHRAGLCPLIDQVVVATSDQSADDPVAAYCDHEGIACFRGSLEDVLHRYAGAVKKYDADAVVRITGDCPLIDPDIIGHVIEKFRGGEYDYVSNVLTRTYPRGLDTEILRRETIERLDGNAGLLPDDREHVVLFIRNHPEDFRLGSVSSAANHSDLRWTVDTPADLELIRAIYAYFKGDERISWTKVLDAYKKHPEWREINRDVPQKSRF